MNQIDGMTQRLSESPMTFRQLSNGIQIQIELGTIHSSKDRSLLITRRSWICSLPNAIPPQGVNPKTSLKIRYPGDLRHRDCPKIDILHFCHGLTPAKTRTTIRKVLKPHIREPRCNQKHISAIDPHKRTRKKGHQKAITSHRPPLPRHRVLYLGPLALRRGLATRFRRMGPKKRFHGARQLIRLLLHSRMQ